MAHIIDVLREEHRSIETLLCVLERELRVFDRGDRPDYHIVQSVLDYFEEYPESCHHPKEDVIFEKLKARDPGAADRIGDLDAEHKEGAKRLRKVTKAVAAILTDRNMPREEVDKIIHDYVDREREHIAMEERFFFPKAIEVLEPTDWNEITDTWSKGMGKLSDTVLEEKYQVLQRLILQWEQEAESARNDAGGDN